MKPDIVFFGILGLVIGLIIFTLANLLTPYVPTLISDPLTTAVIFSILIFFEVVEMPVMVFGIRQLSSSAALSRRIIAGIFMLYVSFAAVYAHIFILLTDNNYFTWGLALAALGLVRFASGIFIK